MLGTVEQVVGGVRSAAVRTTPEAIDLQATFARDARRRRPCLRRWRSPRTRSRCGRADAIHWAAGVFTNLTQDHLDFHPDMEDYFQAKRRLFERRSAGCRVINVDDAYGRRLAAEFPDAVTIGIDSEDAALRARDVQTGLTGSAFSVDGAAAAHDAARAASTC